MKKIFIVIVLLMVFIVPFSIKAEELDDSTIIKFDSYPGGSLSSKRDLTFVWTSSSKMEDLIIKVYLPEKQDYVEVFNMEWDLTDKEAGYDVEFMIVNEPVDNPETEDIDESLGKTWTYKVTFTVVDQTLGVLKFVFEYMADGKTYRNPFFMSNIVYPVPTPEPNQPDEDEEDDANDSTKLALIAAMFAAVCSLIGTILIVLSSQSKKTEDEEIL